MNFEHILLKNLIINHRFTGKVSNILKEKHFADIANKELFKVILSYYSEYGKSPNLPEIIASVKNIPNSELKQLIVDQIKVIAPMEPITNEKFLETQTIEFIKNAMITEALIIGADGIQKNNDTLKQQAYTIMEEASRITIDTDLGLEFSDIDRRIEYYKQKLVGVPSGQSAIDDRIGGGFLIKTLSIVAAPPGIGKSLLMADVASNVIRSGKNVLFIALEMSEFETAKRIDANVLDLPINDLKNLDESVIRNAYDKVKDIVGKLFYKEFAAGAFSATNLTALLDTYRIEKGVTFDLVIIDYLGLMKSTRINPSVGSYAYVKSIAEEVRGVAVVEGIPIISPAQLNRSAINSLEVENESMAESAGILQTADLILLILQTREMKEAKEYLFKLTKNRFTGDTSSFMMGIDYTRMRFISSIVQPNSTPITPEVDNALTYNENTGTVNDSSALSMFDFGEI